MVFDVFGGVLLYLVVLCGIWLWFVVFGCTLWYLMYSLICCCNLLYLFVVGCILSYLVVFLL